MSEEPAPYDIGPEPEDFGLADLLRDAILELRAVEDLLERPPVTPEQARALAELQAVVPPDDWPRE